MIINKLDNIQFRLNEAHDFPWLKKYGTAFCAFDETGSGCISIGMKDGEKKYFCKIAGANTIEGELSPMESIAMLKNAVNIYVDLQHPHLIKLIEHYAHGPFYVAVFEWTDGECLYDHWNFSKYAQDPTIQSPGDRFKKLSVEKRLAAVEVLFSFMELTASKGYVAVDLYDGSILYDFDTDRTMICDIDFFKKAPVYNDRGADWFGSKRLKAPEEYVQGACIDEATNVFTLGALIFEFFGNFSRADIIKRYEDSCFYPCGSEQWQLDEGRYLCARRAVSHRRQDRYQTISEFRAAWQEFSPRE